MQERLQSSASSTHQTAVHGKNLFVNDGSNRETVEAICECLPQFDVIATLAWNMSASHRALDQSALHSS